MGGGGEDKSRTERGPGGTRGQPAREAAVHGASRSAGRQHGERGQPGRGDPRARGPDANLQLGGDSEAQPAHRQMACHRPQGLQHHQMVQSAPGGPPGHRALRGGRCYGKAAGRLSRHLSPLRAGNRRHGSQDANRDLHRLGLGAASGGRKVSTESTLQLPSPGILSLWDSGANLLWGSDLGARKVAARWRTVQAAPCAPGPRLPPFAGTPGAGDPPPKGTFGPRALAPIPPTTSPAWKMAAPGAAERSGREARCGTRRASLTLHPI